MICFVFLREMTSEGLKLRDEVPEGRADKILQKVNTFSTFITSPVFLKYKRDVHFDLIKLFFLGDAGNTKSKQQQREKLPSNMPSVEAVTSPPDPVEDVKASEEDGLSSEAQPAKDGKKGSTKRKTMDRRSSKSRASSAAPRITIKLVAKKKTVKERHETSTKKKKSQDIQANQISSAHVKLKAELPEGDLGTEDSVDGTLPVRRRGRSASKVTETVCQPSPKALVNDQKLKDGKPTDPCVTAIEGQTKEPKINAKKLKHRDVLIEQISEVNQRAVRRSSRVSNPLSNSVTDCLHAAESQSKNATVPVESKTVPTTVEFKQVQRRTRQRQSKRLNKEVAVSENYTPSSTDTSSVKDEMRIPSLKLIRVRNPKYDAQASGKDSARKKKRKKFIWTLTLVKEEVQKLSVENTEKVAEETVTEVDQSTLSNAGIAEIVGEVDKILQTPSPPESKPQNKGDVLVEEKSIPLLEVSEDPATEVSPVEIQKADCGKVPPLQIKKVSSPSKRKKSSKPSFLIQQVVPVHEKEDVLKDPSETHEDNSTGLDTVVAPTRRLRRRAPTLDSRQTKSLSHKPVPTQKRRLRKSPQERAAQQVLVNDPHQVSSDDLIPQVLPENSGPVLPAEPSPVTNTVATDVLERNSLRTDDPSHLPGEISPCKVEMEKKEETQHKEAKDLSLVENKVEMQKEEAKTLTVLEKDVETQNQEATSSPVVEKVAGAEIEEATPSPVVEEKLDTQNQEDNPLPAMEHRVEPQHEDAKTLPALEEEAKTLAVASKPKRSRNSKVGKKKSTQKKKAVVPSDTTVHTEEAAAEPVNTESALKTDTLPVQAVVGLSEEVESEAQQKLALEPDEQIQPLVKEETNIQLIDGGQLFVCESEASQPQTLCLQRKPLKKAKKRRKSLIGQRQKHRYRNREGKFAPLELSDAEKVVEGESDISKSLEDTTLSLSSKLVGVQKRYKKTESGLQILGSKSPEPQAKIISTLLEMGLEKDNLKQEETDTLVDGGQTDIVETQPSKSKFMKNIKHFIMPVVSARSSRVIKTPQRFMDDAGMSVLPRRNSPKKGVQLGVPVRSAKRRDDVMSRPISPFLPVEDEDLLSEAHLDVDLFSAQDLEDNLDIAESLFSEKKRTKGEKSRSLFKNSSFKWHMPEESNEDEYTLDKALEEKCEGLFLSSPTDKPTEVTAGLVGAQKTKSSPKFAKQSAPMKIFQKLNKVHTVFSKSKSSAEVLDSATKPPQFSVDLAEGLDDEAISISLRQRNTSSEKEKSKLKIEDLGTPGVVRKVCIKAANFKSFLFQQTSDENQARRHSVKPLSGE